MSLDPPQANVQLVTPDGKLTTAGYALLKGYYDSFPLVADSFTMKSPDGTSWIVTVNDAGALVVSPA